MCDRLARTSSVVNKSAARFEIRAPALHWAKRDHLSCGLGQWRLSESLVSRDLPPAQPESYQGALLVRLSEPAKQQRNGSIWG